MANLLRNAMRYAGNSDTILIAAEKRKRTSSSVFRDSGPGIPKADQSQVFDPFYRPESSRSRESGGTGLGLAIVKTCVESCGGTVSCHNRHPAAWWLCCACKRFANLLQFHTLSSSEQQRPG